MKYLLDANVFIQAKNLHYGLDFCPAFWEWMIDFNAQGQLYSIEKVGDEIEAGGDDLTAWARARGDNFFLAPDAAVATRFGDVSHWVTSQQYDPAAISTFLQVADFYLVSHALAHEFTLVTHEVPSNSNRKIKIPNVCIGVGVRFMSPYEMLRVSRARFVLGK